MNDGETANDGEPLKGKAPLRRRLGKRRGRKDPREWQPASEEGAAAVGFEVLDFVCCQLFFWPLVLIGVGYWLWRTYA